MPLAFEGKPRTAPVADEEVKRPGWQSLFLDIWLELKQLVRVERVDRLEPVAIIPPENAFILRENLKLRLVNARLALLQRDTKTFREDLRQARIWIERYFEVKAKPTAEALATLGQLAEMETRLDLPKLDATLTALRSTKVNRGKTVFPTTAAAAPAPAPSASAPAPAAAAPAAPAAPAAGADVPAAPAVPAAKTAEAATASAATASH
jgi:uroporphyrin-III C-methyltransferase